MGRFDGRGAIITGGALGIGGGCARRIAAEGARVLIVDINEEAADGNVKGIRDAGGVAEFMVGDVAQESVAAEMVETAISSFGRLDLLVNNAGITSIGRADLLDATEENWDALMAVNLKGPFFLSQLAARWMVEQTEADAGRRPKIINISSVSAHAVSTNRGDYCVAKAGLGMVTKLFAARLADHGINVYEVCPGVIASDMTAPVREKYDKLIADGLTPIRRWGEPSDVGKAVVALAHDYFPFTTGEVFNVDGGFNVRKL